jgi:hypothetical protein
VTKGGLVGTFLWAVNFVQLFARLQRNVKDTTSSCVWLYHGRATHQEMDGMPGGFAHSGGDLNKELLGGCPAGILGQDSVVPWHVMAVGFLLMNSRSPALGP